MGRTPRSNGVYLREQEVETALAMNRLYNGCERCLEALAVLYGWELHWRAANRRAAALIDKRRGVQEIWLPKQSEFTTAFRFAHEASHFLYAPELVGCRDLPRTMIARWEAKANAFAALFVMPYLEYDTEDMVRRAFGPELEHGAHARIQHFKKYGW
jgi:hypothetical protein